jgi:hypothetical protein
MDDTTIRLSDDYYIVTAASSAGEVRVLKHDDSFGVFDRGGDIQHAGLGEQAVVLRRGDLHIFRTKFIFEATCYETLELANYSLSPIELSFTLQYDADFADILRSARHQTVGARSSTDR